VEAERTFSACGLWTLCYDSTIDALCFIRNALPKQWMLKLHGFRHTCSVDFNPIWPVTSNGTSRTTPTNLRKLAACVVPAIVYPRKFTTPISVRLMPWLFYRWYFMMPLSTQELRTSWSLSTWTKLSLLLLCKWFNC